ncbi:MAG: hypothetical protein K6T81_17840 [Alicyclobacillus macrosporangiidus]|nr:hypothetical protein [Alicyclobacillus macrosporangiidus]
MHKPLLWLLLGIALMASGVYLTTKINRKAGRKIASREASVLWSILEFFLDFGIGAFTGGPAFKAGSLSVLMVIVGFFMTLIMLLALIHPGSVQYVNPPK